MWQKIANILLRNRIAIIAGIALMTGFFVYQLSGGLKLDNKYGILLPKNAQAKLDFDKFKEMFGEDGGTLIFAVQTDSLYTEENFLKWKELGDSILKYEGISSVLSEANLVTITSNKKERKFEAHRVFSDVQFNEKSIEQIEAEIKNNPLYHGLLFNDSTNVSIMMISVEESFIMDQKKADVVLKIEEVASSYSPYFGQPKFAGLPHLRVVIGKQVLKEMYIFVALLIVITSLLIYIFFRSFRVILICNLIVAITVLWSMGIIATLNFDLTIITAIIPPLMVVISIPNCIFLITKYHQEIIQHGNKVLALTRVIRKIGTATFLTNFTTSLGFLTFISTNSPKLMQFGIAAAISIISVFVICIAILPVILSYSPVPGNRHLKHLERKLAVGLLDKLVFITTYKRPYIYAGTVLLLVFSILGVIQIKPTGNLTGDLPKDHQILRDFNFLQDNFGGSIPFEVLVEYKEPSRLSKSSTLKKIDAIQKKYYRDTMFTKMVSYIDFLKVANMALNNNDSSQYKIVTSRRQLGTIKNYLDNSFVAHSNVAGVSMNELLDTSKCVLRIRSQIKDIGSYEISDKAILMRKEIDSILNPDRTQIEYYYSKINDPQYIDSLLFNFSPIYNAVTSEIAAGNDDLQFKFDSDPSYIKEYYTKKDFREKLRTAIDHEYFGFTLTGTSIVASNGTHYMVINLLTSLLFAIIAIAILMAILFRSWRMVLVSLIPNFIPLLFTAGVMGWIGIPLKPSTLLVFSIAFGISVDDTIHYLAKYRQELKNKHWDLKECVLMAIREAGLGMFYTSIVLFCGFSMFSFSQFGGTQALGLLVSLTLLIAMITNLVILPTLLLSLERRLTTKSFEEPYFDAYSEGKDVDWDNLPLESGNNAKKENNTEETN